MTRVVGERTADPAAIWRVINGFTAYWAVVAAVRLGVFDALAGGPLDARVLATRLGCDHDRLSTLGDALGGLGLLQLVDGSFSLTPESDSFLVAGRPRSMRDLVLHSPGPWENWEGLAHIVRGDAPRAPAGESFYASLVRATFPTQHAAASALVPALGRVERVLDLGAGAGPWTAALLEGNPGASATVNDLPTVCAIARETLAAHGLDDRCEFVEGDYFSVELPNGAFDVVVLGHVLRAEGAAGAPALLRRAASALRRGGQVIVADYFVDDDRRGPLNALLLGVTMMTALPGAATFTRSRFASWLAGAGFVDVETRQPVPFQEVMLATYPGGST